MTPQEIFDFTTRAIIKQGGPSVMPAVDDGRGTMCAYRHPELDRCCAAGHLIPAELYDPSIEGDGAVAVTFPGDVSHAQDLIEELQSAHDNAAIDMETDEPRTDEQFWDFWREELTQLAMNHHFDRTVIEEIPTQ